MYIELGILMIPKKQGGSNMKAYVNGTHIYFDVEGIQLEPDGPRLKEKPVCFTIHGGPGGDHTMYKPGLSPLSDLAQIVYIDNRGSGRSDRTDPSTYTLEQNVDDLEALRKYLGLEKIVVLGQSYGGRVAMRYAIKYPDSLKGLILITTSPNYRSHDDAEQILKERGTPEQIKMGEVLFNGAFESDEQLLHFFKLFASLYSYKFNPDDPKAVKAIEEGFERVNYSYKAINKGFGPAVPKDFDLTPDLPKINVPTLVIGAKHDWITPPHHSQVIADNIPNAKLKIMQESSHLVFADEPEETINILREFITQL